MTTHSVGPNERREIERLLSLNEDQLYATIPSYLPEYRGTLFSPQRQVSIGKDEFEETRSELREFLCERWALCDKLSNPKWDDPINLVAAIADAISAQSLNGIPPFVIGVLLFKIGLRAFCGCES